jgi:hypothetical protein
VLLAVGVVLVVVGRLPDRSASPTRVVTDYFSALQDDDAAKALSYGDLPDAPRTLLTADVLSAQQSYAPMTDFRLGTATRKGAKATVAVTYKLAYPSKSIPVRTRVALHKDGHTWRLDAVAIPTTLHLARAADRARLLGGAVPTGEVLLFPGAVPISFDNYLVLEPQHSAVDFGTGAELAVGVDLSAAGKRAVVTAVADALKHCLATSTAASTCPTPSDAVPGTLHADLTSDVTRAANVALLDDATGAVAVTGSAGFTGSFDRLDLENVPQAQTDSGSLPLTSWMYLSDPLTVVWGTKG